MGPRSLSREGGCLVIGHRGGVGTAPENTLAAFSWAFDSGADAVETDVRITADGVPVAIHDPEVIGDDGSRGLIHQLSLEQLRAMCAARPPDEGVPTLTEVLALASSRGRGVVLEVKNLPGDPGYDPAHEGAVDALSAEVNGFPELPVLVISFNPRSIERCRQKLPGAATGFLSTAAMDPAVALRYARESGHDWVLPNVSALLAAGGGFIEQAHSAGLAVGTWTINEPSDIAEVVAWGIDGVISDHPADAVVERGPA